MRGSFLKSYQALIASFCLHLLFMWCLKNPMELFQRETPEPIEWIEIKEINKPLPSDKTRRVKKQTRTQIKTNLLTPSLTPPQKQQAKSTFGHNHASDSPSLNPSKNSSEQFTYASESFLRSPRASSLEGQRQQLQSYLPPELEIADVAALNTDQDIYYSFYRRMSEKLIWPWARRLNQGFRRLQQDNLLGGRKKWETIVEVILDKDGNVVATQPLKLAGYWEIDGAPIYAFKQAKRFPNPPPGMLEEDGYIRIRYRFVVHYNPNARVRRQ